MRDIISRLAVPAVAAGIAILVGAAIAVGIGTSPTPTITPGAAAPTQAVAEHVMPVPSRDQKPPPSAWGDIL